MVEIGLAILGMVWLGVGGWAFRKLAPDTDRNGIGVLFVLCILLGPFLAGTAVAELPEKRTNPIHK